MLMLAEFNIDFYTAQATTVRNETCQDRDLRLVDGSSVREGRVEVCYNQAWGTICNQVFGDLAAGIFCNELGFTRKLSSLYNEF